MSKNELMVLDDIQSRIYTIRGVQVMLDKDLAGLYGVKTKRLNEQVKRNKERFPEEFMFQLTSKEVDYDEKGEIAGIEVLSASIRLSSKEKPPRIILENLVAS